MTKHYAIRILDTFGEPNMLDINPDFIETEDTCYSSENYFTNYYSSIEEAEQALTKVIADYPNNYIAYTILPIYAQ